MNEAHIFILADKALERVVSQITARQWDTLVPDLGGLG
jgi:hypothetical protein